MLGKLRKGLKSEKGQGMVEYIIIVALVALIVLGAVKLFGEKLSNIFTQKSQQMERELSGD